MSVGGNQDACVKADKVKWVAMMGSYFVVLGVIWALRIVTWYSGPLIGSFPRGLSVLVAALTLPTAALTRRCFGLCGHVALGLACAFSGIGALSLPLLSALLGLGASTLPLLAFIALLVLIRDASREDEAWGTISTFSMVALLGAMTTMSFCPLAVMAVRSTFS